MANSLFGLWHDIIIGSNYDNSNIGNLGTTGTHSGKRLVSWSIKESNTLLTALEGYRIGPYVLGDTTALTGNHILITDMVKQGSFPMIHMSHNRYYRCARN